MMAAFLIVPAFASAANVAQLANNSIDDSLTAAGYRIQRHAGERHGALRDGADALSYCAAAARPRRSMTR
jgi:hypothetical protein